MNIAGIQRTSTIDFPGVLSCVLFTPGCNLNCFYCHNRQLICCGDKTEEQEVINFLEKRKGLLDGVVISGGEPTLQPDLIQFITFLNSMGYKIKLDTNGLLPDKVKELVDLSIIDYIAVDFKAPKDEFKDVCGIDGYDNSKKTIELLINSNIKFEVRTTLYPGLTAENLIELLKCLPPMPKYRLNFYNTPKLSRAEDAELLNRHALTKFEITEIMPKLLTSQPNIALL